MDNQNQVHDVSIEPGELVYDSDHQIVGRVSGVTDDSFEAEVIDPSEHEMEELPGQEFGEGYLMWRCIDCGEMDELSEGVPESCPNCSAPPEAIAVVEED